MGYRKTGCFEQMWYVIKHKVSLWLEWLDAKDWAKEYHPAWVEFATKSKSEETRNYYKDMILAAYRGADYV